MTEKLDFKFEEMSGTIFIPEMKIKPLSPPTINDLYLFILTKLKQLCQAVDEINYHQKSLTSIVEDLMSIHKKELEKLLPDQSNFILMEQSK